MADISATDIIQWQNQLLSMRDENDKPYSQTYLRTVQNQLSAIFNHACRFYGLSVNPSNQAGKMGKAKSKEMLFWTKEEYMQFAEVMKDKPVSYYAFEILYWTGIREGELLALERKDFDLDKRTLTINKSFQHLQGEDYVTSPKTEKSNRIIELPEFLCHEMEDYFEMIYKCDDDTRLFTISKSYLHHEMDRGSKQAGVKRIRIHDLRHSHVAHCIELGFSPLEIAERMGHEGISITLNYAHLYPSKQRVIAEKLNEDRGEADYVFDDTENAEDSAYCHYRKQESLMIRNPKKGLSLAENILQMIRVDGKYTELEAKVLDTALILHAEHGGGNNSTFTTHVVTSSGTDTYSSISASIGSLKGPRHGGANLKVQNMFRDIKANVSDISDESEIREYLLKILDKEAFDKSGLIYGMGHAVYTLSDPREVILKEYARKLSEEKGILNEFLFYDCVERLAGDLIMEKHKVNKNVCANVDFYSGFIYTMLGIPEELFTPIFAMARIPGWCAHRLEELLNGNKIIRPAYKYVGQHVDEYQL